MAISLNEIRKALTPPVWPSDCELAINPETNETANVNNYNMIYQLIIDERTGQQREMIINPTTQTEVPLTFQNLFHAIQGLRIMNLLIKTNVSAPNPIRSYPHEEIAELKNIRTLDDVKRLESNPEALKKLKNLNPASPAYKEINERIAHIKQFDIRAFVGDRGAGRTTEAPKGLAGRVEHDNIIEARRLVENLKPSDFAGTNSSNTGGKYTQLIRAQENLNNFIDSAQSRGFKPADVLKFVKDKINSFSDSGIR
jgi:hypothetical protein